MIIEIVADKFSHAKQIVIALHVESFLLTLHMLHK